MLIRGLRLLSQPETLSTPRKTRDQMQRSLASTFWSCYNNISIAYMAIYIALPIMLCAALLLLEVTLNLINSLLRVPF